MTTIPQLLAAHLKAVEAIDKWLAFTSWRGPVMVCEHNAAARIRDFCSHHSIGSPWLDSIESLLSAIEAKLAADAPLSDEEIEGMKWRYWRGGSHCIMQGETIIRAHEHKEAADYLIEQQNKVVEALAREIRRLRAKCGEVAQ